MNERTDGTIYFLAGLLLGGLFGAGIGIIVAPESGDKTIAKLRKHGEKAVKKSLDAIDEFQKAQIEPTVARVSKDIQAKIKDSGIEEVLE